MRITANELRQYGACSKGVEYIERVYPNGAQIIDIIQDKNIEKELLHWGRKNLTHTPEEFEVYCKACNIINTDNHWYSHNLRDCLYVVKSHDVENSQRVFDSNDVNDSSDIVACESVSNSSQVFTASLVDNSQRVAHCANVNESNNVCFSKMLSRCVNIYNSKNVFDSSEIVVSENVTDSYFCQNCKNIKHCMFCDGLENAEYYLFNQPVDKERFELFVQQYKRFMQCKLAFASEWPENLIRAYAPAVTRKIYEWYKPIPEKFWKWAKTLPGYDSMMLYNITMLPEILVEE